MAVIASAQSGMVHRRQVIGLGITRGSIEHRLAAGSLHRVLPAVYAVGHTGVDRTAWMIAALLYARRDCVISHATAAALWELVAEEPQMVALTVAARRVRQVDGVRIHEVADLDARDVRFRYGLPVTAPARTLIDLAATASDAALERALNEARLTQRLTDAQLSAALDRCPGRTGTARVRALLRSERGPAVTRSDAERLLRGLVDGGRLPAPQYNVWVLGHLVDAVWPDVRVVVEVDGYDVHARRRTFESDRRRDQRLTAAGYVVVRITWRQLTQEPMAVLASLAQALAIARERHAR